MPFLPLALGAALATTVMAPHAAAQTRICGEYDVITAKLTAQFGEQAIASGTSHNGRAYVEIWASEKSGTWSVVTVMPNGMSCLTSAGQDFQPLTGKPAKGRLPVT